MPKRPARNFSPPRKKPAPKADSLVATGELPPGDDREALVNSEPIVPDHRGWITLKDAERLRRAILDLTLDKLTLQEAARGNF